MVNFSEGTAQITKRTMEYIRTHEKELQPRTISISLKKHDDYLSEALRPGTEFAWYSDEPKERGGQGKGPSPLSYFLSAMGFCQFVHYTEHCIVENLKIDSLEMKIDGKISMQRPRRFTEVNYEVRVSSSESDEVVRKVARAAAEDCYVTNTLRNACKVTGVIIHNGKKVDEHG